MLIVVALACASGGEEAGLVEARATDSAVSPAPADPAEPEAADPVAAAPTEEPVRTGVVDGHALWNGPPDAIPAGLGVTPGHRLVGVWIELWSGDVRVGAVQTDGEGRFRLDGIPEGRYVARLRHDALPTVEQATSVVAGSITVLAFGYHPAPPPSVP
jgi:hypothetical protein